MFRCACKCPRRHAGQRNAVIVAQFDERVTVRVLGDQRRQLLNVHVAGGSVMSVPPCPSDAKLNVPLKLSNVKLAA
jgi:hypothetical protein